MAGREIDLIKGFKNNCRREERGPRDGEERSGEERGDK
jgi:hypothetical protein